MAKKIDVDYVLPGVLYLRGQTRTYFFNYLKKYDYSLYKKISSLYYQKEDFISYKKNLFTLINQLKKIYNLDTPKQ